MSEDTISACRQPSMCTISPPPQSFVGDHKETKFIGKKYHFKRKTDLCVFVLVFCCGFYPPTQIFFFFDRVIRKSQVRLSRPTSSLAPQSERSVTSPDCEIVSVDPISIHTPKETKIEAIFAEGTKPKLTVRDFLPLWMQSRAINVSKQKSFNGNNDAITIPAWASFLLDVPCETGDTCGNQFVLLDWRQMDHDPTEQELEAVANLSQLTCNKLKIADDLLLLQNAENAHFRLRIIGGKKKLVFHSHLNQ